jgi:hypothetical protein
MHTLRLSMITCWLLIRKPMFTLFIIPGNSKTRHIPVDLEIVQNNDYVLDSVHEDIGYK